MLIENWIYKINQHLTGQCLKKKLDHFKLFSIKNCSNAEIDKDKPMLCSKYYKETDYSFTHVIYIYIYI